MQDVDILIIDESRLFREGMTPLLTEAGFAAVGEAESIEEAAGKIEAGMRPKLVLIDFGTTESDLSTLGQLRERVPAVKLAVLAAAADDVHSLALCFEAGADAYLLKAISPEALAQSLRLVLLGEKVFPTRLAALLVNGAGPPPAVASTELGRLSNRETQILCQLLTGQPNKVIAKALNITEATVKVHLKGLMKKIQTVNRTQAAIWALNNGLSVNSLPMSRPGQLG